MDRLVDAFAAACRVHAGRTRSGTRIPSVSHPLAVCALVLDAGGSDAEACAALLRNAPDDVLGKIAARFGDDVAAIVHACAEAPPEAGAEPGPWLERKQRSLLRLSAADASALLVSAADTLHRLRTIVEDERVQGPALWERFSAPPDKRLNSLWYDRSLLEIYLSAESAPDARRDGIARQIGELLERLEFENASVPLAPALEFTFDAEVQAGYLRYREHHVDAQIKCDIFESPDGDAEVVVDREADGGVFGVEFLGLGPATIARLRAVLERYRLEEPPGLRELILTAQI